MPSQSARLLAAFCAPGLEAIAAPLLPYTRRSEPKAVALVGFLSARAACRSASEAEEELANPEIWERIREKAAALGRVLPEDPPTYSQLHKLRQRIGDDLPAVLVEMQHAFTAEAIDLARRCGMLDPAHVVDCLDPTRGNTIYADGTWWKSLSEVLIDDDGVVHGSRSKTGRPREKQALESVKDKKKIVGVPFAMCGVRDNDKGRVVLGMRRFYDPFRGPNVDEMNASMELLERVISAAEGGVGWCVYDMAMVGVHLNDLAMWGVVGVAAMKSSKKTKKKKRNKHAEVPDGEPVGPTNYNSDRRKRRVTVAGIRVATHWVDGRRCDHSLSAVDGSVRCHDVAEQASLASPLCPIVKLRIEPADDREELQMLGTYEVPCDLEPFEVTIRLSGKAPGTSLYMLNRLRPISEYDPKFKQLKGWRQDVESLNSTMKREVYLHGRASSLDPAHFELDVLGMSMQLNAQLWDERFGRVTHSAQRLVQRKRRQSHRQRRDDF